MVSAVTASNGSSRRYFDVYLLGLSQATFVRFEWRPEPKPPSSRHTWACPRRPPRCPYRSQVSMYVWRKIISLFCPHEACLEGTIIPLFFPSGFPPNCHKSRQWFAHQMIPKVHSWMGTLFEKDEVLVSPVLKSIVLSMKLRSMPYTSTGRS